MQHRRTLNAVTGRLSLRAPPALSLKRLAQALEAAPAMLHSERALDAVLATLKADFPTLQDRFHEPGRPHEWRADSAGR